MDIQKTMEFILEQQAATAANLKQLQTVVAQHSRDLEVHTEWKTEMSHALQDLAGQMRDGFVQIAARHNELAAAQKETEERLNILIRTAQEILPRLPKQ